MVYSKATHERIFFHRLPAQHMVGLVFDNLKGFGVNETATLYINSLKSMGLPCAGKHVDSLVKDSCSLKQTNKQSSITFKYAPHQNLAVPPSTTVSPDSYSVPQSSQTCTQSHSLPRLVLIRTKAFAALLSVLEAAQFDGHHHVLNSSTQ